MSFQPEVWYDMALDGPPPFDTLVLVYANVEILDTLGRSFGFSPQYCLAYNQCYRPDMMMTQVLELPDHVKKNVPIFVEVPFAVEKWQIVKAPI